MSIIVSRSLANPIRASVISGGAAYSELVSGGIDRELLTIAPAAAKLSPGHAGLLQPFSGESGAGAFIGSLWAIGSSAARSFADTFYRALVIDGLPRIRRGRPSPEMRRSDMAGIHDLRKPGSNH